MGKRELVLIVAFIVVGAIVYQFTSAAPAPGSEGAGISAIWRGLERHIKGARATATVNANKRVAASGIQELRVNVSRFGDLTITGSDRNDLNADFHVTARGLDDAEARAAAAAVGLQIDRAGDALVVSTTLKSPIPGQVPSPQIALTLDVPRRLALRVGAHAGRLTIAQLASADVEGSRGDTRVTAIAGAATIDQASGTLTIDDCGSLHLKTRNGRGHVTAINATASITASGGSIILSGIRGPLDIESRNADVSLSDSPALAGPLRVNATGGTVHVAGLRIDARIEARNAAVDVGVDSPAPISIETTRGGIHVTPPAAGYTLDAVATDGRVTFEDGALTLAATDAGQTAMGPVRGGGATLTLRASHADIEVRPHAK